MLPFSGIAILFGDSPTAGIMSYSVQQGVSQMFTRVVEFSPASDAAAEFTKIVEQTGLGKAQAGCIAVFVKAVGQSVIAVSVWQCPASAERFARECYPSIVETLRPFLRCTPSVCTLDMRQLETSPPLLNTALSKAGLSTLRDAQAPAEKENCRPATPIFPV